MTPCCQTTLPPCCSVKPPRTGAGLVFSRATLTSIVSPPAVDCGAPKRWIATFGAASAGGGGKGYSLSPRSANRGSTERASVVVALPPVSQPSLSR